MRYVIFFAGCFWFGNLYGYEFQRNNDDVLIEKYKFQGRSVWSEAHKQAIINTSASTITYTSTDFVPSITVEEQAIFEEIMSDKVSIGNIAAEIEKRKGKAYNLERMIEQQKSIMSALELKKEFGFDVSSSTKTYTDKLNIYKGRYNK